MKRKRKRNSLFAKYTGWRGPTRFQGRWDFRPHRQHLGHHTRWSALGAFALKHGRPFGPGDYIVAGRNFFLVFSGSEACTTYLSDETVHASIYRHDGSPDHG